MSPSAAPQTAPRPSPTTPVHTPPLAATVDELVRREQASLTIERSRSSNALSVPTGLLICWFLWDAVDTGLLLGWLAVKTAVTLYRVAIVHRFDRGGPRQALHWGRRFEGALAADGLTYGVVGALAATSGDTVLTTVMVATVIAIAAVGLVVLSMNLRATLMFVLPVMLPSLPLLVARGDDNSLYLAAGSAVFLALVIMEGARASAHTVQMLRLRFRMDELAAQRAQALEAAEHGNAVKRRFLATMSHEMRTPLHGILGLARLLRPALPADGEGGTRLAMLERTGEHLLGLIDDVLDHSRIEDGRLELTAERFDLRGLLLGVAELARVSAREKGLALETDLSDLGSGDAPVWVTGDAARLRQILLNLLGNAVKFTDRGHVRLRAARRDGDTVIDVVDTGIGVGEADRERIFGAFEQVDSSDARRHGGSGLGLTISRELARAMGGDVRCLSPAGDGEGDRGGGGAVFRVTAVLPPATPPARTSDADRPLARLRGRVLLAEDNPVNALVAEAVLLRHGLEVTVAVDGREAVERAEREAFQLILMDAQMPGLDGFQAAARIRDVERARGLPRTPIVAVTANALPSDRARSLAAGMDDHLAKPFRDVDLEGVLHRYLAPTAADARAAPPHSTPS